MNIIDDYFSGLNIYFSLLVYRSDIPHQLVEELKRADYPVVILHDLTDLDFYEINHRMFVIDVGLFAELMFLKGIAQYSVIFCMDDDTFDCILSVIEEKKPSCVENILITKI